MRAIKQSIRQVIILLSITLFSTHVYATTALLKGHIYHDKNANATQDNREPNLSQIRVVVTDKDNMKTTYTDQNGDYSLFVEWGDASVYIDETTLPIGMVQTEGTNPTPINIPFHTKSIFEENNGYVLVSDLTTKKTVDKVTPQEGSTIVYTLTVTNKGPAQATHVSLMDKLPAGLIYMSHTGGNYIANSGIWSIGTLNNGATATLNITVRVDQGTVGSTITNVATAASTPDQTDPTTRGDDLDEPVTVGKKPIMIISDVREIEGTPLVFDINLSNPSATDTVIELSTEDGNATAPEDYTATTQTVTIPAGSQGITFTVPTIDDTIDEADEESIKVNVTITEGTVSNPTLSALGMILDNDGVPTVTIGGHNSDGSTKDVREIEGTPLVFDINLSNPSATDTVIELSTEDGNATAPEDYTATTQTVTIPAGSQGITFTVPTIDDTIDEADEESIKVNVTITEGTVSNPTLSALGMILDNDGVPTVTIGGHNSDGSTKDVREIEGTPLVFDINLSNPSATDTVIELSTEDGNATAPEDYTATTQTVTIPAGSQGITFTVPTIDDTIDEADEESIKVNVTITEGTVSNPTLSALGMILDNDGVPTVTIGGHNSDGSTKDVREIEGTPLVFDINLSNPSATDTVIELSTEDGNATAPEDYTATTQTVTIPAGSQGITFTVPTIDDTIDEADEESIKVNVTITEGTVSNPTLSALGMILDNDGVPTVTIGGHNSDGSTKDVREIEGTPLVFDINLSNPSATDTVIELSTEDGNATAPEDYTATTQTVTIPAGSQGITFTVPTIDDTIDEADEESIKVNVTITEGTVSNPTLSALGMILDNDGVPTVTIGGHNSDGSTKDVREIEGTPLVFDINLSNPSATDTVIELSTEDGNATAPEDYTATTQTVTIPAGSQGITFTVPTIDDTIDEADEESIKVNVTITEGTVSNPTLSALGMILDNDGVPTVTIGGHNSDGSTKDVREIEGTPLVFDINLSNPSATDTVIELSTEDGNATAPEDYTATTQTVTIPAGSQGITFTVPTIDDTIDEADEESIKVNVTITEGTVSNPTLSALGMILDNDGVPTVTIGGHNSDGSTKDVREIEGTPLVFDINLSNPSATDTVIELSTEDGNATAPEDYTATTQTVTIPAGSQGITFTVPTIDDTIDEADEESIKVNVTITEGTVSNPTLSALGMILDNDGVPTVTIGGHNSDGSTKDVREIEGTPLVFDINLSNPSATDTVIELSTEDGNATAPEDYTATTQTVTIPAGSQGITFTVPTIDDTIDEADEESIKVNVTITEGTVSNPTLSALGMILDNDGVPTVTIGGHNSDGSTKDVREIEGTPLVFDINLSNPSATDTVIELSTEDGNATAPEDYTATTQTVTIPAGSQGITFTVPTIDDTIDEADEESIKVNVTITEGTVSNPTLSALGMILDNDVMTQRDTLVSDLSGVPTSINILDNDSNSTNPQSINLIPHENAPIGTTTTDADGDGDIDTVIVPGEGVWSVDDDGIVTFTPEDGFTGDPTSIDYTVEDDHGHISKPTSIQADYPQTSTLANDDNMSGNVGDEISINVLENDMDQEDDINISSVNLIVPENTPEGTTPIDTDGDGDIDRIVVPGEGVWGVDDNGIVTFTPEDGFTGDPTPISYTVKDDTNAISNQAIIRVDFLQELRDDNKTGIMHRPVEILILNNDDKVDPSSVNLHASESATEDDTDNDGDIDKIIVPGEGVWSIDENATLVFVPEVSFEGDPTSITYTAEDENKNSAGPAMVNIHYVGIGGLIEPQAVDDMLTVLSNREYSRNTAENDIAGEGGKDKQIYHLLDPDTGIEIAVGEKIKLHYGIISMQANGHYTYASYVNVEGGEDTINYSMKDTLDQTSSANILIKVACTSSQLSDSGGSKNIIYLLLIFLFMGMTGLYNIQKEEKSL